MSCYGCWTAHEHMMPPYNGWQINGGQAQSRSLKYLDVFFDFDWFQLGSCFSSKRKVAHLAFDAARIASIAAGADTFLQDLVENGVMKGTPLPRGGNGRKPGDFSPYDADGVEE